MTQKKVGIPVPHGLLGTERRSPCGKRGTFPSFLIFLEKRDLRLFMPPTLGEKKNIRTLMNGTEGTNSSFLCLGNDSAHPSRPHSKSGKLRPSPNSSFRPVDKPLGPGLPGWKDSSHGTVPAASIAGVWPPSPHLLPRTREHTAHKQLMCWDVKT